MVLKRGVPGQFVWSRISIDQQHRPDCKSWAQTRQEASAHCILAPLCFAVPGPVLISDVHAWVSPNRWRYKGLPPGSFGPHDNSLSFPNHGNMSRCYQTETILQWDSGGMIQDLCYTTSGPYTGWLLPGPLPIPQCCRSSSTIPLVRIPYMRWGALANL